MRLIHSGTGQCLMVDCVFLFSCYFNTMIKSETQPCLVKLIQCYLPLVRRSYCRLQKPLPIGSAFILNAEFSDYPVSARIVMEKDFSDKH